MYLACVMVFALLSRVAGTPHGYGVKSGAVAKAEAIAAAGAFGGLGDLAALPAGGSSYSSSGSFSKSSASSFAASSASSFSYSGAGGFTGTGGTGNGCGAGGCAYNGGVAGTSGLYSGSGAVPASSFGAAPNQGYSAGVVNPLAIAGAAAFAGTGFGSKYPTDTNKSPCVGDCSGGGSSVPKCEGANCAPTPSKCASGQCHSNLTPQHNDIPVNIGESSTNKNPYGTSGGSDGYNKSPSTYNTPDSKCNTPNCDALSQKKPENSDNSPYTSYNPKPGTPNSEASQPFGAQPDTKCTSLNCQFPPYIPSTPSPSSQTSPHLTHTAPATHLLAPKESPKDTSKCSTPDCAQKPQTSVGNSGNIPVSSSPVVTSTHSTYPELTPSKGSPCGLANCDDEPGYENALPLAPKPQYQNANNKPATNCGPSGCGAPNYNTPSSFPSRSQGSPPPSPATPEQSTFNCRTGNCGNYPSPLPNAFSSTGAGATAGTTLSGGSPFPPTQQGSTYHVQTPGQTTVNCNTGNCGSYPSAPANVFSPTKIGATSPGSSYPVKPQGSPPPNQVSPGQSTLHCATGNCGSYPSAPANVFSPTGTGATSPASSYPVKPQGSSPPNQVSPGQSTLNCATGNCGSYPSAPTNAFGSAGTGTTSPGSSPYPVKPQGSLPPNHLSPGQSTLNCATGDCGSYPSAPANAFGSAGTGATTPGSSPYPVKPQGSSPPNHLSPGQSTLNCATGDCGSYPSAPANAFGSAGTGATSPGSSPYPVKPQGSSPPNHLSPGQSTLNCATGDCGSYPSAPANAFGSAGTGATSPGSSPYPVKPQGSSPPNHLSPGQSTLNCATGNCGSYPSAPANAFGSPGAGVMPFGSSSYPAKPQGSSPSSHTTPGQSPFNCATGNCGSHSSPPHVFGSAGAGATAAAGAYGTTKPTSTANTKGPAYTGGFGGPSGLLKPNDYSVPTKPGFGTPQQSVNKPNYPSVPVSAPSHQASGPGGFANPGSNLGGQYPSQPNKPSIPSYVSGASAVAGANAIAYTGGFGGPPGFLKPFDNGVQSSAFPHYQGSAGSGPSAYNQGSAPSSVPYGGGSGSPFGSTFTGAGAVAGAGATAGNINGYYGKQNSGGQNVNPGQGCNGGCGSNNGNFGLNGVGVNAAGATGKSIAGALSNANAGAGSFGVGGQFASSSASAHASASAGTKGGYGKR